MGKETIFQGKGMISLDWKTISLGQEIISQTTSETENGLFLISRGKEKISLGRKTASLGWKKFFQTTSTEK